MLIYKDVSYINMLKNSNILIKINCINKKLHKFARSILPQF